MCAMWNEPLSDGFALSRCVESSQEVDDNNPRLEALIEATNVVRGIWAEKTRMTLRLRHLMPRHAHLYYAYSGSLTFPPCTSNIPVLVMAQSVAIGEDQVRESSSLFQGYVVCQHREAVYSTAGDLCTFVDVAIPKKAK